MNTLLGLFAEQTPQHALILLGPDRTIVWWSPKAASVFGYDEDEVLGRTPEFLYVPEDRAREIPKFEFDAAHARKSSEDDRWMMRADGTAFFAMGCMVELLDERGGLAGYCKILEDRTDLKEQLEALRNRAASAAQSEDQRNTSLGTLGHEVRNTLAPIANALEIIRLKTHATVDVSAQLEIVSRQLGFIKRLVDDLLDITRVHTGKVSITTEHIDLRDVVNQAVASITPSAKAKNQALKVVPLASPVPVHCDPDRLHQVFINLLNNASKFTPTGGQLTVDISTEAAEAVVKVTDTGSGIEPQDLSRIFELFTQADNAASRHGLGIGLALVREFVALHHGTVQARSDGPGKGSQFVVRLPLAG